MGWLPPLSELVPIFLPSIFLPTAAEPIPDDCGPRRNKTSALVLAPPRQTGAPRKRLPPAERCGKMTVGRTGDGRPRTVRPGTSRADEPNVAIERRALPTPTVNVLGRRRLNMGGHPFGVGRFAPRARMKRQWQFSLASLLLTMLAVAVACAVFPYPRTAFYTLLALLCLAAVLARFGPTRARAFWFWFSLCGWSYVVLGVSLLEAVEGTTFWHSTRDWLQKKSPGPDDWTPEHYLTFCAFPFCDMRGVDGSSPRDFRARSLRFFNDRESPRWVNSSPGGKARTIGCNRAEYRRLNRGVIVRALE